MLLEHLPVYQLFSQNLRISLLIHVCSLFNIQNCQNKYYGMPFTAHMMWMLLRFFFQIYFNFLPKETGWYDLFQLICLKPKITSCTISLNLYLEELLTKNFIFLIGMKYFYCHDKTWELHIVKNDRNEDNFWKNYCIGEKKGKEEKKTHIQRKVPWVRDLKIKQRVTNI